MSCWSILISCVFNKIITEASALCFALLHYYLPISVKPRKQNFDNVLILKKQISTTHRCFYCKQLLRLFRKLCLSNAAALNTLVFSNIIDKVFLETLARLKKITFNNVLAILNDSIYVNLFYDLKNYFKKVGVRLHFP